MVIVSDLIITTWPLGRAGERGVGSPKTVGEAWCASWRRTGHVSYMILL